MTSMRREYGNEVLGQGTEATQRPALQAAPSRVRQSRALHHSYAAASAGVCRHCEQDLHREIAPDSQ